MGGGWKVIVGESTHPIDRLDRHIESWRKVVDRLGIGSICSGLTGGC